MRIGIPAVSSPNAAGFCFHGRILGRLVDSLRSVPVAALAHLAVRSGRAKDLKIIVFRHQLTVIRRHNNRPALNEDDGSLLGAIAAALPRSRRHGRITTPDALLRWHR